MIKTFRISALVAAVAVSFGAQAELKAIDDATMSEVSGQSGIVIEAGFGTISGVDSTIADFYGVDWSGSGVTIDAFKYIVDVELGWNSATNTGVNKRLLPLQDSLTENPLAGFIARDIKVAGAVDITIDATADVSKLTPDLIGEAGGIGITFANSNINFKIGDMGVFVEPYAGMGIVGQQLSSFGGIELLGMNVDGLEMVVRGNGM